MSKNLDFAQGNDTGEADEDAIAPVNNGESASEEVFNRPTHSVRRRTETLRAEANHRRWVDDADRGMTVSLFAATVTWGGSFGVSGGTGILSFTGGGLLMVPSYSPGFPRGDWWEGGGFLYPTRFAHFLSDNGTPGLQDIQWVANKFDYEGGNEITITVTGVPGYGATTVVVNGDGTVPDSGVQPGQDDIVVTFDSTAGTPVEVDDIINAIISNSISNQLVTPTYVGTDPIAFPAYDIPTTKLSGGIDGVHHYIPVASFDDFFAVSGNELWDGDAIGIWYDNSTLRRASIEEVGPGDSTIPDTSLVNLTQEPDKAPGAVIIGKVIDGDFVFVNGVSLQRDVVVDDLTIPNRYEADAIIRADLNDGIATPPAPGGGTVGADHVGMDPTGFAVVTAAESVQEALDELDSAVGVNETGIDLLNNSSLRYTELYNAYQGIGNHRTAVLQRPPTITSYEGQHSVAALSTPTGTQDVRSICCDGVFWYRLINGDGAGTNARVIYEPEPGTSPVTDFDAGTNSNTMVAISANGSYIAVADGTAGANQVRVFDMAGSLQFSFDHTGVVSDIHMDDARLFVVGTDEGVGFGSIEAWLLGSGTQEWYFSHGQTLNAVYSDGRHVFAGGNSSGPGAPNDGAHIRKWTVDGTHLASQVAAAVTGARGIICSDKYLYALCAVAGIPQIRMFAKEHSRAGVDPPVGSILDPIADWTLPDVAANRGLAIDTRYLYVGCILGIQAFPVDNSNIVSVYEGFVNETFYQNTANPFDAIQTFAASGTYLVFVDNVNPLGVRVGTGFDAGLVRRDDTGFNRWQQRRITPVSRG